MSESSMRIETKLVHAGEPLPRIAGAVQMPIFQSATYEYGGEGSYHDVRYLRTNSPPSQLALHAKLAALEGSQAALVTASGMAAISTTLLTVLSAGDHLLAQSCLYGGTHDLLTRDFAKFGLAVDFIDADRRDGWQALLRPNTRAIYVEAMTNPLLQVADLNAVVEFARANGLVSIIDNTFASPINYRPIEAGFDLSIHSATKYLNGHADIVAGAVAGGAERFARKVRIPIVAPSLGGVHTLLTRPASTSHAGLEREDRLRLGIGDALLRLSVGIEATEDLLEDFGQALS